MDTILTKCEIAKNNHLDPTTYASALEQLNVPNWTGEYFWTTKQRRGGHHY